MLVVLTLMPRLMIVIGRRNFVYAGVLVLSHFSWASRRRVMFGKVRRIMGTVAMKTILGVSAIVGREVVFSAAAARRVRFYAGGMSSVWTAISVPWGTGLRRMPR